MTAAKSLLKRAGRNLAADGYGSEKKPLDDPDSLPEEKALQNRLNMILLALPNALSDEKYLG